MPPLLHEAIQQTTAPTQTTPPLVEDVERAESWAGEPFIHPDEESEVVLAPGTARRQALDDALKEIDEGLSDPSPDWKIHYALMLGLDRVLSDHPPKLRSGTELRRHQVDALAGMLTELIASNQRAAENGNGALTAEEVAELEAEDEVDEEEAGEELAPVEPAATHDPGAQRRYRFRHPTASGKTIAAAGFV